MNKDFKWTKWQVANRFKEMVWKSSNKVGGFVPKFGYNARLYLLEHYMINDGELYNLLQNKEFSSQEEIDLFLGKIIADDKYRLETKLLNEEDAIVSHCLYDGNEFATAEWIDEYELKGRLLEKLIPTRDNFELNYNEFEFSFGEDDHKLLITLNRVDIENNEHTIFDFQMGKEIRDASGNYVSSSYVYWVDEKNTIKLVFRQSAEETNNNDLRLIIKFQDYVLQLIKEVLKEANYVKRKVFKEEIL